MKCFYHLSDMDGWCSAAIVALTTNNYNKEDYIGIDYNKHKIEDYDMSNIKDEKVFISDLSFTEHNMNILINLIKNGNDILWNDHHDSSIELIKKYPQLDKKINGRRSKEYSGAMLTYMCINNITNPLDVPRAIRLVSDWDTFQHQFGDITRYFKYGIDSDEWYCYPLSTQWKMLLTDKSDLKVNALIYRGHIIDDFIKIDYKRYLMANAYESELEGVKCAVVNRSCNSLIFGNLYEKYPMVATFTFDGRKYKYSLYSNTPETKCNMIASKYGGGGHVGAAGFSSDNLVLPFVKEIIFNNEDLPEDK